MKNMYIIGTGGFGREAAWCVERINDVSPTWNLKGVIVMKNCGENRKMVILC